jgi:hypothetical protein
LISVDVPFRALDVPKLLLEYNTRRQPLVKRPIRLKSQQMLDFFAFCNVRRAPDCGQLMNLASAGYRLSLGASESGCS